MLVDGALSGWSLVRVKVTRRGLLRTVPFFCRVPAQGVQPDSSHGEAMDSKLPHKVTGPFASNMCQTDKKGGGVNRIKG